MAEYLFIQLLEHGDPCTSIVLNEDGHIVRPVKSGTIADAAADAEGRRVIALVPGAEVVMTQVALPALNQSRLRQMLPFSLEEAFAEDVDKLLFAAGPRLASGEVRVSVAAHAQMQSWLDLLGEGGLTPSAVYSDADGVPDTPSTLSLILDGSRIYARRAGQAAVVLEDLSPGQAYELLASRSEDRADLAYVDVYVAADEEHAFDADLNALQQRVDGLKRTVLADGVLARLAANLLAQRGTNLLQGPYAPKSNVRALLKPWHTAAALLLVFVAVQLAGRVATYFTLHHEEALLTQMLNTACRQQFSTSSLSTCRSTVGQTLRQAGLEASAGAKQSFLSTLAAMAEKRDPKTRIKALSYRNNIMDLQVIAPSISSLDTFSRKMIATQRFKASIQSATPGDAGVEGHIQVTGANP